MDETTKRLSCTSYSMQSYLSDDTNESRDQPPDDDRIVVVRRDSLKRRPPLRPALLDEQLRNRPVVLEVVVVQVHIDASRLGRRRLSIRNYSQHLPSAIVVVVVAVVCRGATPRRVVSLPNDSRPRNHSLTSRTRRDW